MIDTLPCWDRAESPIWLVTHFQLRRNLEAYPFPAKLSKKQQEEATKTITKLFPETPYHSSEDLSPATREHINDYFSFQGSGCLLDPTFSLLLHDNDHIALQTYAFSPNWEEAWHTLTELDMRLSKKAPPAYSPRYGYLTADPKFCGTGLAVRAYLHLPLLHHFGKMSPEHGTSLSGLAGGSYLGDIAILSNRETLGVSEDASLHTLHTAASHLMLGEKQARDHIRNAPQTAIVDKVSRAYGMARHAHLLNIQETLDTLSGIKLGADLGWIEGISDKTVNELYFATRRAHLLLQGTEAADIPQKRAEMLRSALQNCTWKL